MVCKILTPLVISHDDAVLEGERAPRQVADAATHAGAFEEARRVVRDGAVLDEERALVEDAAVGPVPDRHTFHRNRDCTAADRQHCSEDTRAATAVEEGAVLAITT